MLRLFAAYCLLLFCISLRVSAQDGGVFIPSFDHSIQPLKNYFKVVEDKDHTLNIESVVQNNRYSFHESRAVSNLNPHSVWWLKLEIVPAFSSDSFCIGLPDVGKAGNMQGNDLVDVWIVENLKQQHFETGILTPLSRRPIKDPINRNLFPLSLVKDRPLTVYMRVERELNFLPPELDFAMVHRSTLQTYASPMLRLALFYTGCAILMFGFGLAFLIITRERSFAWFCAAAFLLFAHMQMLAPENQLTKWLFPEHPRYQFHLFEMLSAAFSTCLLQLIRHFLNTNQRFRKWDKTIRILIWSVISVVALNVLLVEIHPAWNISALGYGMLFIAHITVGVGLSLNKDLYARWCGYAMLWLFGFQLLGILWNENIIPAWFPNPWAISQLGLMVILFFVVAHRFKHSSKEKAEAAKIVEMDAIKSRFFANISHELRTPLTLILGPLRQVNDKEITSTPLKKNIVMMRRNAERLLQLINQLLDISKLESGNLKLAVSRTDIGGVLRSVATSFEALAEQRQINYYKQFPEHDIVGYCDKDKLEKIVVNLLSNAFRFTAANGTVSFLVEADAERVRFTVQDNGRGIPNDQIEKIFDRFHQVGGTEGGTGIGLSLTKELLHLHKGQISVQSEKGKGSSFRVSIPVIQSAYTTEEIVSRFSQLDEETPGQTTEQFFPIDEDTETGIDSKFPSVLVVEDNADLQDFIASTLQTKFKVEVANDGADGLKKALEQVPDCIISDIMMPVMDGIEFARRIKAEPATSHVPVVLLTAKAGTASKIEGLQTGADDYLVKPFDATELITRIQNLVDQRQQLREKYSSQVITLQPEEMAANSIDKEFIDLVRNHLESNIDNDLFGVSELADAVHLSRSQLHRKLKSLTGFAPNELIRNFRLERAMQLLQQQAGSVAEIAFNTGFNTAAYFSKCFLDRYGYSPTSVLKEKSGENKSHQSLDHSKN